MKILANDGSTYEYEITQEDGDHFSVMSATYDGVVETRKQVHVTREVAMLSAMHQAYVDSYEGSDSQVDSEICNLFDMMVKLAEKFPFPA